MKWKNSYDINATFRSKNLIGIKKDQFELNLPELGNGQEKRIWHNYRRGIRLFRGNISLSMWILALNKLLNFTKLFYKLSKVPLLTLWKMI